MTSDDEKARSSDSISDSKQDGDCCPECKVDVEQERQVLAKFGTLFNREIEFAYSGKAGEVARVSRRLEFVLFRGENLWADDTLNGRGTRIRKINIGGKRQRHPTVAAPTASFHRNPLGCGLRFNTAQEGEIIEIVVEFTEDCAWSATMVGKAVLSEHSIDVSLLTPGGMVLDVGCRDFSFSRRMVARGCRVIAMDADPTVEDPKIEGVQFIRGALSDHVGVDRFLMHKDPQARRLLRSGEQAQGELVPVRLTTLKVLMSALRANPFVWDVVKLDVEGAEYDILRAWQGPIAKQISVEFHEHVFSRQPDSTYEEIIARLASFGYEVARHERDRRHCCPENFWDSLFILRERE